MASGISIKGREVLLTIGGQTILGVQTKGISVNNEMIDTTDDNSAGWIEYSAIAGQKSVELPISGMVKNLELLRAIMGIGSQIYACTITYPDNSVVAGDFAMTSFSDTGEYGSAYTFEVTLASSGVVTFTAGT